MYVTSHTASSSKLIPECHPNSNICSITDQCTFEPSPDPMNVNFLISSNKNNNQDNNRPLNLDSSSFLNFNLSSSSSDQDDCIEFDQLSNFKLLIRKWAIDFNISLPAVNGLLHILKNHKCFDSFMDSRTLMKTKSIDHSCLYTIEPGTYYHFGIANGILQHFTKVSLNDSESINIVVGIDGQPLFKISPRQFWPILAYLRPKSNNVFPIRIYCGLEKPKSSNEFLNNFK